MSKIYSSFETSKTNSPVPLFASGKSMNSRYNPERESESFTLSIEKSDFFIVIGIGAGYHIKKLRETFPESFILALEYYEEDLSFIRKNFLLSKELESDDKIIFASFDDIEKQFSNYYLPYFYSSFSIIPHRVWAQENNEKYEEIILKIKEISKNIGSDYLTQAKFGKIWQKNIIKNIKLNDSNVELKINNNKIAAIIAAGPSFDKTYKKILENRSEYFIISTDTSYKILTKRKIVPDAVVSIDGQQISSGHFLGKDFSNTIFVFDYCANSNAVSKIKKNGNKIIFSTSGHPFIEYVKLIQNQNIAISLNSGAGTVTNSAVDFALKLGFKSIEVYGADFSFPYNKSYSKGSYLEDIFQNSQNRIENLEKKYSSLMFRSKIYFNEYKNRTSDLLEAYRNYFYSWLESQNIQYEFKNEILFIKNNIFNENNLNISKININEFQQNVINDLNLLNLNDSIDSLKTEPVFVAIIPFLSYFKENSLSKTCGLETIKLAISAIKRYTELI